MLSKQDMCAFDSEWFGMDKARLHRPGGTFASMACTIDGHTVYYITDEKLIQEFMERIAPALWTGHNLAFDIRQLRMFTDVLPRKRVWDTMLVEQIRFRGYYDDFALNDLARRYLGIYVDKTQQKSFGKPTMVAEDRQYPVGLDQDGCISCACGHLSKEEILSLHGWDVSADAVADEEFYDMCDVIKDRILGGELFSVTRATDVASYSLTKEQIVYGALDVASQWMIAKEQREQIDEQDLWIWQNIERPFMWLLLDIKGIRLDTEKWMKIATEKGDIAAKAWQECNDEYGINSLSSGNRFKQHKSGPCYRMGKPALLAPRANGALSDSSCAVRRA
jgi:hypothetical protein